jgi:hypothetical protein
MVVYTRFITGIKIRNDGLYGTCSMHNENGKGYNILIRMLLLLLLLCYHHNPCHRVRKRSLMVSKLIIV